MKFYLTEDKQIDLDTLIAELNERRQSADASRDDVAACIAKGDHCPDIRNSNQVKLCCYATAYDIATHGNTSKHIIKVIKKRLEDTLIRLFKDETVPDYPLKKNEIFHYFIPYQCVSIIYYLLTQHDYQRHINKCLNERTPLHLAVEANNITMCKLLVAAGADMTAGSHGESRLTVLHSAAVHGADDIVCYILLTLTTKLTKEDLIAFIDCQGEYGETALYQAARNGYFSMVKCLVMHGANCLQRNDIGELPVVGAIKGCSTVKAVNNIDLTCRYLLERTDIRFIQDDFNDLCRLALVGGLEKTVDFFIQQDKALSLLEKHKIDSIETVFRCVEKNQFKQDETCDTYKRLALTLIRADFNITSPFRSFCGNALSKAAALGLTDIVALLVQRIAVPEKNDVGDYPLHFNAKEIKDNQEITAHLLKHENAGVIKPNIKGECPLHLAASAGNWRIVSHLLLKSITVINQPDYEGKTPLHRAAQARSIKVSDKIEGDYITVIKALLQAGADTRLKDNNEKIAEDYAASANIKQLFLKSQSSVASQSFALWQHWQSAMILCYTKETFVKKRLFNMDYFSLADYFINLQVIIKKEKANKISKADKNKYSHRPLREQDRLEGKKRVIMLDELFQPLTYKTKDVQPLQLVNTVLISGAAGVGKTTLMNYIAYQWALFKQKRGVMGLWSAFEAVLTIRCRDLYPEALELDVKKKSIADLLRCTCWGQLDISLNKSRELLAILKRMPDKCLLLFDGLDELPEPKQPYWRNLLVQLFQLPFKKLVTTRPYAIGNLQQWLSYEGLVEISGFTNKNVVMYFEKVLGQSDKTYNFIKEVKQNKDLWAITHIPIHAYLLKTWWTINCAQEERIQLAELSISDLYHSLVVDVCRRYLAKVGELDENKLLDDAMVLNDSRIHCLLATLGCWAFEGLRQDTVQLPIGWLKGVQGTDEDPTLLQKSQLKQLNVHYLKELGLLKQVGHGIKAQAMFEFLHLSFQEFLAASIIAVTLKENKKKQKKRIIQIIHAYKYHPNFTLVWPLVSGLLKRYPRALNDFLSHLIAGPRDWVGFVEFDLLMRCLESSLTLSTDTNSLKSPQRDLQQFISQQIQQFSKLPKNWLSCIRDSLCTYPRIIRLNADAILMLLQNEKVDGWSRGNLAISAALHLSQTSNVIDTIAMLLRNETVERHYGDLMVNALMHLSQAPGIVDTVVALLRDNKVDFFVHRSLVKSMVLHLSQTSSIVTAVLQDKTVNKRIRCELAKNAVVPLPEQSGVVEAVITLLRDETISVQIRSDLASKIVSHLSKNQSFVDVVCALFRDKRANREIRYELVKEMIAHLFHSSEFVNMVWAFLRNKKTGRYYCSMLMKNAIPYLFKGPGVARAVLELLQDEKVKKGIRREFAKNAILHLSQTPAVMDTVWVFFRNETMDGGDRKKPASNLVPVSHLSKISGVVDAVYAFLQDETISGEIRCDLAISVVSVWYLPKPGAVDAAWAFLRDERVEGSLRSKLAKSVISVSSLPKIPGIVDAIYTFLRDESVDVNARCDLARGAASLLSKNLSIVSVILALLHDESVDTKARCALAISAVSHLSKIPDVVDTVMAFLQDETVDEMIRTDLAKSTVSFSHLFEIPSVVDTIAAFLRDQSVDGEFRCDLVEESFLCLSKIPRFIDAIMALLQDKTVDWSARCNLVRSTAQGLFQNPGIIDTALALLQNEEIKGCDRSELARSIVSFSHLYQIPNIADVVMVLLRDETIDGKIRCSLARKAVSHLSQTSGITDMTVALLRDERINEEIRCNLARKAVLYLSQIPGIMDAVFALLRGKRISGYVHNNLVKSICLHCSKWPNKTSVLLDSLFTKDSDEKELSKNLDIPVHAILPLYEKINEKGRQYIIKQLVKHRILVYEQEGTVMVVQAGQTKRLHLSQSTAQQIKQTLQSYRLTFDDSASVLSSQSFFATPTTTNSSSSQCTIGEQLCRQKKNT